jgi:hypothetical protein
VGLGFGCICQNILVASHVRDGGEHRLKQLHGLPYITLAEGG